MNLDEIHDGVETRKPTKRLGRGIGSGQGKTAGRGHKGDYAHNGAHESLTAMGGQMALFRRIGKRGFNNKFALRIGAVNLRDIEEVFSDGDQVNAETLRERDLARYRYDILKILGTGELTKKVTITAHRFSASARAKIEKAGATIVELATAAPVVKNKTGHRLKAIDKAKAGGKKK